MKITRIQQAAFSAIISIFCALSPNAEAAAPAKIVLPDPKYPTVQSAVEALAPAGVLNLGSGTFSGPVVLNGKAITIVGTSGKSGSTLSVVGTGANVITLSGEHASLTARNIYISGGSGGIVSTFPTGIWVTTAPKLSATNIVISGAGKGISGIFHTVRVQGSRIRGCANHGLSVVEGQRVTFTNTRFENNGGVGCLLTWTGSFIPGSQPVSILGCLMSGNEKGGFEVQHLAGSIFPSGATITGCRFNDNAVAGVTSYDSIGIILRNCEISNNATDGSGHWGNGVRVSGFYNDSVAGLTNCQICENAGAGICLVNDDNVRARLIFSRTTIAYNSKGIVKWVATGSSAGGGVIFDDSGSNLCLPPSVSGDTQCSVETLPQQLAVTPATP